MQFLLCALVSKRSWRDKMLFILFFFHHSFPPPRLFDPFYQWQIKPNKSEELELQTFCPLAGVSDTVFSISSSLWSAHLPFLPFPPVSFCLFRFEVLIISWSHCAHCYNCLANIVSAPLLMPKHPRPVKARVGELQDSRANALQVSEITLGQHT